MTTNPASDSRREQLSTWLETLGQYDSASLIPASEDASARRYFRVQHKNQTRIVMDAPPALNDLALFLHVATLLEDAQIRVPTRYECDAAQGFLSLEDFGSTTMQAALLNPDAAKPAHSLYLDALKLLSEMQLRTASHALPRYDQLLRDEMALYPQWYLTTHLKKNLSATLLNTLQTQFDLIYQVVCAQEFIFIHRDFHSRNLMCLADGRLGVLDFQGALLGPITYDAVSLLKDAYLEWPEEQLLDWLIRYWEIARKKGLPVAPAFDDFYRTFEWTGLQRHLKILGIFARLNYRDHKPAYLQDLPLVKKYVRTVLNRYVELAPLLRLFDLMENTQTTEQFTF